jgi:hypothetical protein
MAENSQIIAFIFLAAAILLLLLGYGYLYFKVKSLLAGGIGKDIPDTLKKIGEEITHSKEFEKESIAFLKDLDRRLKRSTQAVGVVRFNAFKENGGGGQSFAITFLSEEGSGVVISSIYGREKVSVYSKPIEKFISPFELTDEEKESLKEASLKIKKA